MSLRNRGGATAIAAVACMLAASAPASAARNHARLKPIRITTIPPTPGVRIVLDGRRHITGADGSTIARPGRGTAGARRRLAAARSSHAATFEQTVLSGKSWRGRRVVLRVYNTRLPDGGSARFERYFPGGKITLAYYHPFRPRFQGPDGRPIDQRIIDGYRLKSGTGAVIDVKGARPVTLHSARVVPFSRALVPKDVGWSVERVLIDGTNVVNRAQYRFSPHRLHDRVYPVRLLFYPVRVTSVDAVFGFHVGSSIRLRYPSGRRRSIRFTRGEVVIPALPRGTYDVKALAPGFSPQRPLAVSRPQDVRLKVITWLDMALVGAVLAGTAIALLVARRPHLRRALWRRLRQGAEAAVGLWRRRRQGAEAAFALWRRRRQGAEASDAGQFAPQPSAAAQAPEGPAKPEVPP